jgi:hypothetical protein
MQLDLTRPPRRFSWAAPEGEQGPQCCRVRRLGADIWAPFTGSDMPPGCWRCSQCGQTWIENKEVSP